MARSELRVIDSQLRLFRRSLFAPSASDPLIAALVINDCLAKRLLPDFIDFLALENLNRQWNRQWIELDAQATSSLKKFTVQRLRPDGLAAGRFHSTIPHRLNAAVVGRFQFALR
jgi:hypothetical protein